MLKDTIHKKERRRNKSRFCPSWEKRVTQQTYIERKHTEAFILKNRLATD